MKQEIYRGSELIFEAKFRLAFLKYGKPSKIPNHIQKIDCLMRFKKQKKKFLLQCITSLIKKQQMI